MDRGVLLEELRTIDRRLAEIEQRIIAQQQLIASLRLKGAEFHAALELLAQLEKLLASYITDRARLRRELAG
jgi:hypothetical protein